MIRPSTSHATRNRHHRWLLGALLTVAAAVAGCASAGVPTTSESPSSSPSPASPSVAESPSQSPSSSPSASAGASGADCMAADLQATSTGWAGAAGSRGADVSVQNTGPAACSLTADPVVALVDPSGAVMVQSESSVASGGPSIAAGATTTFLLRFSNWCDTTIAFPANVQLVLTSGTVAVSGLTATKLDDLPPCNGAGQSPLLTTLAWGQR